MKIKLSQDGEFVLYLLSRGVTPIPDVKCLHII